MIRTLGTQMRVRRLLRTVSDYLDRLAGPGFDPELARLAASRTRQLVAETLESWSQDLEAATEPALLSAVDRHVRRELRELDGLAATLARPGADLVWLGNRFREVALPLMLTFRGLENVPAELLTGVASVHDLRRTA